ncbi:type IV secretion system protein VirB10 [Paraburkholderia lycopersici]|uniref:Type IV secretion system protein VirB10 n=1 Tax=Paraburkholderia lycopersici TaxID=416944 RepID=A0A1G7A4S4_9BURK|nr:type IV secretion system protein VirB10 [Paraburkholderia lycopersici]SDE09055.1 type IV secretion system protein VirB10 [Paraburkholderia lycopersici]
MSDELNRPSRLESSASGSEPRGVGDLNTAQTDAEHADLYDVPPTPQRETPDGAARPSQASSADVGNAAVSPTAALTGPHSEPARPEHPDGFPDLNRHRQGAGGIAKRWLGILAFVAVTLAGAIWAVHRVVTLHQAEAKHARDVASDKPAGGRSFDIAAQAPSSASGAAPLSAVAASVVSAASAAQATTPANGHAGLPASANGPVASHSAASWYDADLIVGSGDAPAGVGASGTSGAADGVPGTTSGSVAASGSSNALTAALTPTVIHATQASLAGNRDLRLSAGAKIACAGDTAFDSTLAGISTCTVTSNVYSDTGHVLLIERGSTINTEFRSAPAQGQRRVFILSARIQTPNGVFVQIESPAADALGRMGIDGAVDNHWGERLGAAFMLSLVQDSIGYLASRSNSSNGTVVFQNTEQTGNDMADKVLNSTINIPPTITKNQGADFLIVLARDIDFSSVYQLEAKP